MTPKSWELAQAVNRARIAIIAGSSRGQTLNCSITKQVGDGVITIGWPLDGSQSPIRPNIWQNIARLRGADVALYTVDPAIRTELKKARGQVIKVDAIFLGCDFGDRPAYLVKKLHS